MDEEKAVLEFFAQAENLPLALSVANQIDAMRAQMNSRFWQDLKQRIDALLGKHAPDWQTEIIEDRSDAKLLLGLQCKLRKAQPNCLFPMLEQQHMGGKWRIFFGLMWQGTPTPAELSLHAVVRLRQALYDAGFKSNEHFIAWRWTDFYPRHSNFLLDYAKQPGKLLDEAEGLFRTLLPDQSELISQANASLKAAPTIITLVPKEQNN